MEFWIGLPAAVQALLATGFTYLMTALGASVVFFSNKFSKHMLNAMQGVAAGIMIAASFFSLLLPAQERLSAAGSGAAAIAAVLSIGFLAGGAFIVVSSAVLSRFPVFSGEKERGGALMFFAMTLHNIPEGFAVGVAFGSLAGDYSAWIAAVMLAVGIGIQNFPEGLCVSVPLRNQGMRPGKAFLIGQFSGLVEIAAGVLGAVAVEFVSGILPWVLSFSAGAMIAVSCSELIPSGVAGGKVSSTLGVAAGFAVMMFLDVLLG